jgi:hypothetical protein
VLNAIDHASSARNLYLDRIRETETFAELQLAIERFRHLPQDIRREIAD